MGNKGPKALNLDKIKNKKTVITSSKKALKGVIPVNWSEKVKTGKMKITVYKTN